LKVFDLRFCLKNVMNLIVTSHFSYDLNILLLKKFHIQYGRYPLTVVSIDSTVILEKVIEYELKKFHIRSGRGYPLTPVSFVRSRK
jgi:hypothetical protein